jgi:hypothetical protein
MQRACSTRGICPYLAETDGCERGAAGNDPEMTGITIKTRQNLIGQAGKPTRREAKRQAKIL